MTWIVSAALLSLRNAADTVAFVNMPGCLLFPRSNKSSESKIAKDQQKDHRNF